MAVAVLTRWFKLLGFQVVARGGACTCEDVRAVPCRAVAGGLVGGCPLQGVGWPAAGDFC